MSDWQLREHVDDNTHAEMEPCKRMNIERSDGDGGTRVVAFSISSTSPRHRCILHLSARGSLYLC
jgi:hypothetical protein